ncbi:hypothetical protein [Haloarcula onubensis]|uniref:DUF2225 domain-containing protein n=1 Tax=Haloarcula onubensis TaxID=2950539 RepID=A0ABU2FND8_9EURY|nr:hypothetical protein [Halomicroarcula sp. S3CR25-11]MDS0281691.1 DUF2225 domain-containing protein [Halomicroarcula sp. S3CR25-11]
MSDRELTGQGEADADEPVICPVCGAAFDSVSVHDEGLMVNMRDNDRYQRVCLEPVSDDGVACIRFFHHTHEQAGSDQAGSAGGRIP